MDAYFTAADGAKLFYRIDDCTDQWKKAETVIFVHGLAESTEAWRAWVPYFARHFRVIRFDIRGFGQSTPMPRDHKWSIDELLADIAGLMAHLKTARAHFIGAKSGGTIAMKFAVDHPDKVGRLALACAPVVGPNEVARAFLEAIENRGVEAWARETMPGRFRTTIPPEAIEWWVALMGKTPKTTLQGYLRWVPGLNITEDVKSLLCPTLVITADAGPLHDLDEVTAWQRTIRNSELKVVKCEGWHAGAALPDVCAPMAAEFLRR